MTRTTMYRTATPNAYRESAVMTASPIQLVVMLYDGAAKFLRQAIAGHHGGKDLADVDAVGRGGEVAAIGVAATIAADAVGGNDQGGGDLGVDRAAIERGELPARADKIGQWIAIGGGGERKQG